MRSCVQSKICIMLDRDGTIIVDRHYLSDPRGIELLPGALKGLRSLSNMGMGLVVVTNQSAIGRGMFDLERLHSIHQRLVDLLKQEGVELDGIYYCPHTPEDECNCRKPQVGMVRRAAMDLGFDPAESFMIGDKLCDVELGARVGATTILVRTGYGACVEAEGLVRADHVVDDLCAAADVVQDVLLKRRKELT